jgi:RNA polymerase sigma-B factor
MSSSATADSRPGMRDSLALSASTRLDSDEQLLRRYQEGDVRAREELVHRFLPLTKRLAGRYRHTGESQEDLEQVACMGLIKAVDRFDPELGPFVRYAVPNIMGELKRHFRDKGWGMHVPRSVQERFLRVNDAMDELAGRLGRSPSPKDIAGHTGLTTEEVLEALDAATAYSPMTLDAPHPGDGDTERTLADSLGAEDPSYGFVDLGQALAPAFRALPPREQLILKLRFIDDYTQSEIAEQVGVSQMHVSRLLRRSLDRLNAAADGPEQPEE